MTIVQDLAGKVVVVTGAGRGIGRQIAIGAAQRGAKVALVELIAEMTRIEVGQEFILKNIIRKRN